MNDDIERLLKSIQPAGPSQALREAVALQLAERQKRSPSNTLPAILWCGSAAVAACAAFLLLVNSPSTAPVSSPAITNSAPPAIEPHRATESIFATLDDAIYTDEKNEPVRQVQYRGVKTLEFRDPQTGSLWKVSYPWQESTYVPVQTL